MLISVILWDTLKAYLRGCSTIKTAKSPHCQQPSQKSKGCKCGDKCWNHFGCKLLKVVLKTHIISLNWNDFTKMDKRAFDPNRLNKSCTMMNFQSLPDPVHTRFFKNQANICDSSISEEMYLGHNRGGALPGLIQMWLWVFLFENQNVHWNVCSKRSGAWWSPL